MFAIWSSQTFPFEIYWGLNILPYCFHVYVYQCWPETVAAICRNMGIWDVFMLRLPGKIYPGVRNLFRVTSKKILNAVLLTLCEGNPLVTSGFPSQGASNGESVSMAWHQAQSKGTISRVGNSVPAWNVSFWLLWRVRCDECDGIVGIVMKYTWPQRYRHTNHNDTFHAGTCSGVKCIVVISVTVSLKLSLN